MVQAEEKRNCNEYQLHGSLSAPKLMEELSTRGPTSLVVRCKLHIATGFVSMTITF